VGNFPNSGKTRNEITPRVGNGKSQGPGKNDTKASLTGSIWLHKLGVIMRIKNTGDILPYSAKTKFTSLDFTSMAHKADKGTCWFSNGYKAEPLSY